MRAVRRNSWLEPAFGKKSGGEAWSGACEGIEVCVARADTERPAAGLPMEEVLELGNLGKALGRIEIAGNEIIATLGRRANNPLLTAADYGEMQEPIP